MLLVGILNTEESNLSTDLEIILEVELTIADIKYQGQQVF